MKAVIYAIYDESRWTWRVSLDVSLHTDKLFWSSRSEHPFKTSMFRVVDDLPYGQAIAMIKKMNRLTLGEVDVSTYIDRFSLREVLLQEASSENTDPVEGWLNLLIDHEEFWDKLGTTMKGRSLLWEELVSLLEYSGIAEATQKWKKIVQWAYLSGHIELRLSMAMSSKRSIWRWSGRVEAYCIRCGHNGALIRWSACASCGYNSCAYCESCLTMGKTRSCAPLILGTEELSNSAVRSEMFRGLQESQESLKSPVDEDPFDATAPIIPLDDWQLSPAQLAASEVGIRHLLRKSPNKPFLIWAVTGAGKTEMIFPLIATELLRRGKVLVATPRRDVVLELLPRIKVAFPHEQVVALYGGSSQRWEIGDITIATTHQLIRYEGAFDLVVIDEIDAFPYHNNPVLEYAAHKACSPIGAVVFLSATPPKHLQIDARKGKLAHVKVPVRYHGKPLPLPRIMRYAGVHKLNAVATRWLPSTDGNDRLATIIAQSLERQAQLFIFVPAIHTLEPTLAWVRDRMNKLCNRTQIEATSSQDEHRHDKILRFRAATTRILLTTTILERGVTIAKADVIVLDADSALFDSAALVQMAGRAGRSADDPFGNVYFMSKERTRSQHDAISQIRAMNRLAERRGYIIKGT